MERRTFLKNVGYSLCALAVPAIGRNVFGVPSDPIVQEKKSLAGIPKFIAPPGTPPIAKSATVKRVILVRYGGGVRPEETVGKKTESPFLYHGLLNQGTLYNNIWIDRTSITGHAQGTLYLTTGCFDYYKGAPFDTKYIPTKPTLSEYIRKAFGGPSTDAVLINNSDNKSTELMGFSNDPNYGWKYGPVLLSEWALKLRRLERKLSAATGTNVKKLKRQLTQQQKFNYRQSAPSHPKVTMLFDKMDKEFGEQTLRGDELVAELAVRALRELDPKYLQIHLQDSDYVHWGPQRLYQRGIRRMDDALNRIWQAIQISPQLKDETALVIVPDHGRNVHGSYRIPYQHHDTNDPGSHRIFAFIAAPGVARGKVIDDPRPQVDIAPTIGALLGIPTPYVQGRWLEGVIA